MHHRAGPAIAAHGAAVLGVAVVAPAASARTTRFTERIPIAAIETGATFPGLGSTLASAGPIATRAFGPGGGAQLNRLVVTAVPSPTTLVFKVRGTDFFAAGSQRWKAHGTARIHPDGSVTSRGAGSYTGGAGRFRRARGTFTFTSTQASGSPITHIDSSGTIRF